MSNLQAMALVAALIHVPLALTVWSLLHRRWHALPLRLWVTGALAMGLGATLFCAEGSLPGWATHELANALLSVSPALRILALRLDLGWQPRWRVYAVVCLLDFGGYLASLHLLDETWVVLLGYASMSAWNLVFAWHAAAAGRRLRSRSGWVLAGVEAFFAVTMLLRLVLMALGWTAAHGLDNSWDFGLLVLGGLAAALYGNLGYLGLVLDRTSEAARLARESQLAEALRREAAEAQAQALGSLLHQREQLLQMLARDIRQPLHNASGALQAAAHTLDGGTAPSPALAPAADLAQRIHQTGEPLRRAQGLLGGMQSVLDNTLAAATQLARDGAPLLVDTDLDFMVQLCLGDLPGQRRSQVQVRWLTSYRSAEMEPGLVRLALRNLLLNALARSGPVGQVWLDVAEQADPPALLLQVADDGPVPGAADLLALATAAQGATNPTADPGQGMGLEIVRRVMAVHGGALRFAPVQPRGLAATLEFPQPA